ncbi:MAG: hypothetical protein ABI833_21135 [Acidobacteriota bacterium]
MADANTRMCGLLKGETPTANAAAKTSKEELVIALKASFDYCDPVYASMTDVPRRPATGDSMGLSRDAEFR